MSLTHSKFLSLMLEETFGDTICKVAEPMIHNGGLTLRNIILKSELPLKLVKECLQVLIQHNIVNFTHGSSSSDIVYQVDTTGVMSLSNFSSYCEKVQNKLGEETKTLFSAVVRSGRISLSKLLYLTGKLQMKEDVTSPEEISEIITNAFTMFEQLVKHGYLTRADKIISPPSADVPEFKSYEFMDGGFKVPNICFKTISNDVLKGHGRISDTTNEDDEILWKIHIPQFDSETKEEILTNSVKRRMNKNIAEVFKAMISAGFSKNPDSDSTPSVSYAEIKQAILKLPNNEIVLRHLEESLKVLALDPLGIVTETSAQHGGSFSVNVKEGIRLVTILLVEKLVESRHGPTAARLFRLVRRLGYADQDKVTQKAMLSSKSGRSLLYKLVEAHFVTLKEIRKTYTIASSLANKVVEFVFYVDLETILRSILEDAYKGSINARIRYRIVCKKFKRLLDKERKMQKILFNMSKRKCTPEQVKEVNTMMTYPERKILDRVHAAQYKLVTAQLHANHTIFIINSYFRYH